MLKPSFTKDNEDDIELDLKDISQIDSEQEDDEDGYANVNPIKNINIRDKYKKSFECENRYSKTTSIRSRTLSDIKRDFQLGDIIEFVHNGLDVIKITFNNSFSVKKCKKYDFK
jgi:hypothetical protein